MKDFGRWLQEQGQTEEPSSSVQQQIKDMADKAGVVWSEEYHCWEATCRGCGHLAPVDYDLKDFSPENHWCGGSPRCCP